MPEGTARQPVGLLPKDPRRRYSGVAALVLLVGLGSGLSVRMVGDVFVGELAVLVLVPVALLKSHTAPLNRALKILVLLGIVWLVGQVLTDVIRVSTPADYLRGWANIVIFLVDVFVIYRLVYQQPTRALLLIVSFALGQLIGLLVNPTADQLIDPWKFGVATPLALLALCLTVWWSRRRGRAVPTHVQVALLVGLFAVNLLKDYRSEAGICGVVVTIVLMARLLRRRVDPSPRTRGLGTARTAVVLLGMAATAMLVITAYSAAAQDGLLGADAQAKYYLEYQPGLAILIGGRGEILVSSQAIIDSPIVGHGSWAQDAKYVAIAAVVRSEGYSVVLLPPNSPDSQLIPSHSHLFGAWVEAGILGAVFWLYTLVFVARSVPRIAASLSSLLPLCAYFAVHLSWDILFSPFSGSIRLFDALELAVIAAIVWPPSHRTSARLRGIQRARSLPHSPRAANART